MKRISLLSLTVLGSSDPEALLLPVHVLDSSDLRCKMLSPSPNPEGEKWSSLAPPPQVPGGCGQLGA